MTPIINMIVRSLGLFARFGLTLFIAKFLSLSDVGRFSLVVGISGLMPAISGLGLNFYLTRDLVGLNYQPALIRIRDRLIVTTITTGLILSVAMTFLVGHFSQTSLLLFSTIVMVETIGFDLHMSLIALEHPIYANVLLFLRSSAWALPYIPLALLFPALRNLDAVLAFWAIALIAYAVVMFGVVPWWRTPGALTHKIDWKDIIATVQRAWLIYINDIGIVGALYLDRYIVAGMLGLIDTGSYALYWTLANGVHVLITSATIQTSLPRLVRANRESEGQWLVELRRALIHIIVLSVPISSIIFLMSVYIMPRMGMRHLADHPMLFAMLLVGTCIRLLSDAINNGLYSRRLDHQLAKINIFGLIGTISLTAACLYKFGIVGAGVSSILSPTAYVCARLITLWRDLGYRWPIGHEDNDRTYKTHT